ncbi:hypothetical protein ABFY27_09270 [Akkermansia massiliensis]
MRHRVFRSSKAANSRKQARTAQSPSRAYRVISVQPTGSVAVITPW